MPLFKLLQVTSQCNVDADLLMC